MDRSQIITQSKRSQIETCRYCMIAFVKFKEVRTDVQGQKGDQWLPGVGDGSRKWQKEGIAKGQEETGNDGYIHYPDCDDGFMNVYICQILTSSHFKSCAVLLYQLYLNKVTINSLFF